MKVVTIEGAWLLHGCTKFQAVYELQWFEKLKVEHRETHTHTHTHTHDVLDYSEYSGINIFKLFFHENTASSVKKQNFLKLMR